MRTVQTIGIPTARALDAEPDAVVVALKSRTIPAADAVAQSLAAFAWLRDGGARQFVFKYCSTFDSTDAGNIGPVADALLDALGASFTIACPAFPVNQRTIYLGHLYVGDVLLSDSPMRDHPLTPMRDANLVRVLGRQTRRPVSLVPWPVVKRGADAIVADFARLAAAGVGHAVVDAIADDDLMAIGAACRDLPLVTGGSGIAIGLPQNFRARGLLPERPDAAVLPAIAGKPAVLAGSCSAATRAQVAAMAATHTAVALDPMAGDAAALATRALAAVAADLEAGRPFVIYSTAEPAQEAAVQRNWAGNRPRRWSRRRSRRWRGRSSRVACGGWSWPAARPREQSCRRSGSMRCDRPADRPRRAVDRLDRRAAHRARAQVRQFRRNRLLPQVACDAPMAARAQARVSTATRCASSAARSSTVGSRTAAPVIFRCASTTAS